jgi:thiol-disulfide isomerase/thioredoxin
VAAKAATGKQGSTINGDWEIALPEKSKKGESAWTLRVAPYGGNGEIKAVILRIDGDTGGLYGRYDEAAGEYRVSRFADSGGSILSLKPQPDGSLLVADLKAGDHWTAYRPDVARKGNLGKPTVATEQTTVQNPDEPLRFSGPNLVGTTVSSTDPDFKGKVVIVAIGGSWCPNCHDEAPLLVELYNKYHQRGLEVVDLSFEEDDQLKDPQRLRAFVTQYKIPYPVLVMGTPDELNEKLPQGKNLNCWPTAFFVGRDGLVKETHAGFSGPATGSAYTDLRTETFALIERLLAANQTAAR